MNNEVCKFVVTALIFLTDIKKKKPEEVLNSTRFMVKKFKL